jgi:hypothetical protein
MFFFKGDDQFMCCVLAKPSRAFIQQKKVELGIPSKALLLLTSKSET